MGVSATFPAFKSLGLPAQDLTAPRSRTLSFARHMGISEDSFRRWEKGRTRRGISRHGVPAHGSASLADQGQALRSWPDEVTVPALVDGGRQPDDKLFVNRPSRPVNADTFQHKIMKPAIKRALEKAPEYDIEFPDTFRRAYARRPTLVTQILDRREVAGL